MVSVVSGFTKFNTPRVAQLSQRSNQFNLRTVRYTEADIETIASDKDTIDLSFTLEDKFGDNGLIAVVIMKRQDAEALVKKNGGSCKSSVTKDLTYLVTNDTTSGSSKNVKAASLGIPVITEEQFLALLK